jgi:hypothetical protein
VTFYLHTDEKKKKHRTTLFNFEDRVIPCFVAATSERITPTVIDKDREQATNFTNEKTAQYEQREEVEQQDDILEAIAVS